MKKSSLFGRSINLVFLSRNFRVELQNQKFQRPNPSLYYEAGGAERGDNTEK